MKLLLIAALLSTSLPAFSVNKDHHELAIVKSIDDIDTPPNYIEVSEEGLPHDHYVQMLNMIGAFGFTIVPDEQVRDIFEALKRNPKARMKVAGGKCSNRRSYIQGLLRKKNIVSGKFYMHCPGSQGRMRLRDQVTGRRYTFANFHDTNIVAVSTNSGIEFQIMDVQFESSPVSLHDYLTEIEASQKFRPLKRKGNGAKRMCYWSVSSLRLSY